MALTLSNLKPAAGSLKRKKRVGRGNASGKGTYSSRGMKGQRSRTGGKAGLKYHGMKARLQKVPKLGGFRSPYPKAAVLNLFTLDKIFKDGEKVNPKVLKKRGLISDFSGGVKILSNGELKRKITIEGCRVSDTAKDKIEKAGGKVL